MLFDNVMFSLVLLTHQFWKIKLKSNVKTCDLKKETNFCWKNILNNNKYELNYYKLI